MPTLLHSDQAVQFIDRIPDPVTKNLVNMAFVHLVKKVHLDRSEPPAANLDMLFLVKSLAEFFSEHDVIARTLAGEKVGAWFDDCPPSNGSYTQQQATTQRSPM